MKKITFVIMALAMVLGGNVAKAQGKWGADSAECIKYMSYYQEYFKQKNYDEAIPSWRKAYELCPASASQNLLINGTTLVKRLIQKNANNPEYRKALVDTLMMLYRQRAELYPKNAVTAYNNMGLDMANYVKDRPQFRYDNYEKIIEANKEAVRARILLFNLQSAVDLYSEGKISAEDVINIYQRNADMMEKMKAKDEKEAEENKNIKSDLGSILAASKIASCDNLIELFGPRIEAEPNNLQLATSIVATMSFTEDCTDNDVFLKAVTAMNTLNPSAASAYYLFRLHSARGNSEEAIKYMLSAIESEDTDLAKDTEYYYELATFCYKSGLNAKAYEYAEKVVSMGDDLDGKAYFLMGTIWGSTRCGGDEIASRAPMWVACDYMTKAKNADPTLAEEANRYISQYSAYFPKTEDAFMYDLTNGDSYTVSCSGMRAVTTVRTTK
ncbi:MAG: hypothetical protein MJY89_05265 [Bacteroidales bacterium]|nr:hypothetical protein [Bacteroidales bacterium]